MSAKLFFFSFFLALEMVTPAVKHTIVKKRTAHFKRHQSNRFMRVGVCITKINRIRMTKAEY